MNRPLSLAIAGGAFASLLAPVAAQRTLADLLPETELAALRAKEAGDYAGATERFLELLHAPGHDARDAALAEYAAAWAFNLTRRTGAWLALGTHLDRALAAPLAAAHPSLRDRLTALRLEVAIARADLPAVATLSAALGCIDAWQLIGPFDNERGAGFRRSYGPERELDLDAVYDGKKRPVRWFPLPVAAPPGGRIDLDAMLRPNDQVLAYCATALLSERDEDVLLQLGSDEACKVFVNGVEVFGRDVRRSFAPDQDAVVLPLRPGANLLLLEVCEQEGGWSFAARVTALDGGATGTAVRASARAEDLRRAAETRPRDPYGTAPYTGAHTLFADSVAATGALDDALRLAYLLGIRQPDDPTERRDHALAQTLAAALPEDHTVRYLLSYTRVRPGTIAADREDNARRHDYEAILAAEPRHVQALLALARLEISSAGLADRAQSLLRRALQVSPRCAEALLDLAALQQQADLDVFARRQLDRAVELEPENPRARLARARLRSQRGDLSGAILDLEASVQSRHTVAEANELARLLLRSGARDAALRTLQRTNTLWPFDPRARLTLSSLFEAEGDLAAALEPCLEWLRICPEDARMLARTAYLHGLTGDRDRQRAALRLALELDPNDKRQRRYLEFLEADEQPFYRGHELDADAVIAADPGPPADSATANDPYHYLLQQRVVHAYRNGTTSEYRHTILRVLTEEGARRLGHWGVQHFWGEQRARLLDVRVLGKDGRERRPRLRGASVSLPQLGAGEILDVRERVDDLGPSFFGDYFGLQHGFAPRDGAPCARSRLTVVLEPGRDYRIAARHGVPDAATDTDPRGNQVHTWEVPDLARARLEERQPASTESEPLVRITTYRDWQQFGAWWWDLIKRQLEVSPAMRAKVAELTTGLTDERAKIDAIYRFVTTEIRYTAWEFGVHGYKPYSAPVIFERRHGDCKDKALLLNAMLSVVGIEAYPVLIHADPLRSADDLSLAMVNHFNHCISYVPPAAERGALFLDGTAIYHPSDTVPEMDQGADVLVVRPDGVQLAHIDWTRPADNRQELSWRVILSPAGDGRAELVQEARGNAGVGVREMLANAPAKREELIERRLRRTFGDARIQRFACSDPLDLGQQVRIEVAFEVDGLAPADQVSRTLELPSTFEADDLTGLVTLPARDTALLLGVPRERRATVRYRLPDGFAPVELPAPVMLNTSFGRYSIEWRHDHGERELTIERVFSLGTNRIEPAEYDDFRAFTSRVRRADGERVVVRAQGRVR